jgi:hypothetical protein
VAVHLRRGDIANPRAKVAHHRALHMLRTLLKPCGSPIEPLLTSRTRGRRWRTTARCMLRTLLKPCGSLLNPY